LHPDVKFDYTCTADPTGIGNRSKQS